MKAVHHEVNRLVAGGFVDERREGNVRLIRAGSPGPVEGPLTDLLAVTFGPLPVVEREFRGIEGIREAFIFGSWAARHAGVVGAQPADVDVLVIGDADLDELDEAAERAGAVLHREVNVARVRPQAWDGPTGDPFIESLRANPLIPLFDNSSGGD